MLQPNTYINGIINPNPVEFIENIADANLQYHASSFNSLLSSGVSEPEEVYGDTTATATNTATDDNNINGLLTTHRWQSTTATYSFTSNFANAYEATSTGSISGEPWDYAQSLMMYDIAASQEMYGANFNTNSSNTTYEYGNPPHDAKYWREQQGETSCAVVAQISVYQSLTGVRISEAFASNYAHQQGWFDPLTGTPVQDIGNILDDLGIPTYETYNATLHHLEYALAVGDKPLVALDANEIWNPQYDWYGKPIEQADRGHVVWVTGIDYKWDGSIGIIVNDSGIPNGRASEIRYDDFMNAWEDSNYFVSIADNPLT